MPFYEQKFYPKFIPAHAKLVAHLYFKTKIRKQKKGEGDLDTLAHPKGLKQLPTLRQSCLFSLLRARRFSTVRILAGRPRLLTTVSSGNRYPQSWGMRANW